MADRTISVEFIEWRDIGYTCAWGDLASDGIFNSVMSEDGDMPLYMHWSLYRLDPYTTVEKSLKDKPVFYGFIKWSGCMQWHYAGENIAVWHVDDRDELVKMMQNMQEALERIRDLACKAGMEVSER